MVIQSKAPNSTMQSISNSRISFVPAAVFVSLGSNNLYKEVALRSFV